MSNCHVKSGGEGEWPCSWGRVASRALAFPPRRLTTADLDRIVTEFTASAALHERADSDSASRPLPLDPRSPESFWVTRSDGAWLHLQSQRGEVEGWVRARLGAGEWPLRRVLPELGFLEGAAGFLRQRVGESGAASEAPSRTVDWAVAALARYAENESERAREPIAVAATLSGMLHASADEDSRASSERALADFERAEALVPYIADVRNLALMTRIHAAYRHGTPELRVSAVADALMQAAGLEPDNPLVLRNLASLYALLSTAGPPADSDPDFALADDDLAARQAFLQGVPIAQ